MEQEHSGYFKVGDHIETSGKPEGVVIEANSETFMLRPFRYRHTDGRKLLLENICVIRSNDPKHYLSKYWIKVMPKDESFEFTREDAPVLNTN